jgi:hypothetical protein
VVVLFWEGGIPRNTREPRDTREPERSRKRGNVQKVHEYYCYVGTAAAARPQPAGDESATDNQHSELPLPRMEGTWFKPAHVARELVSRTSKPRGMLAQISVGPGAARRQPAPLSHRFASARAHTCAYARPTRPRTRTSSRTHAHKRTSAAGRILQRDKGTHDHTKETGLTTVTRRSLRALVDAL